MLPAKVAILPGPDLSSEESNFALDIAYGLCNIFKLSRQFKIVLGIVNEDKIFNQRLADLDLRFFRWLTLKSNKLKIVSTFLNRPDLLKSSKDALYPQDDCQAFLDTSFWVIIQQETSHINFLPCRKTISVMLSQNKNQNFQLSLPGKQSTSKFYFSLDEVILKILEYLQSDSS